MLSFSFPTARAKRFVLLFNRDTESWRCLVTGRRIPSKSEPDPGIKSRNPDSSWSAWKTLASGSSLTSAMSSARADSFSFVAH